MGHEFGGGAIISAPAPAPAPTSLAPGFRFHPTDEELVQYYLKRKACGRPFRFEAVSETDVYKSEPWELADRSMIKSRDLEWFFFSPVDRKYGNGSRLNRATGKGYWKATGKDRHVSHKGRTRGMKKTLVFHSGRAPDGQRTNWVMHEYRLVDDDLEKSGVAQDAFVLCRIFQKSGLGPPNGDRYAPFVEEEWDDDVAMVVPGGDAGEEMAYNDYAQVDANEHTQENLSNNKAPLLLTELANICENAQYICKRERSEDSPIADTEPFSSFPGKKLKHSDPNTSNANGSEDSTTTMPLLCVSTNVKNASPSLEFPLLEPLQPKENNLNPLPMFDAANLEKSVPPGYLKFISNLENEILNVSMERETLKIEVMRAQAMINVLQSRIDLLDRENDDLRKIVRGA